jgi:hypothetical protein
MPRLKSPLPFLAILAAALLFLFWPMLLHPGLILGPTYSAYSDILTAHWPKAHLLAQSWAAGNGLPDWSPLIIGGMSLAATPLAMLAYPPAWLFLFLPTEPVFNLLFVFHLLWGGLGSYLLLRWNFRLSPQAALLGGLAFALNSKIVAHAAGGHVSMIAAVSWLPWAVLGMHMLLTAPGWRAGFGWLSLTGAALAMQIATHSQILLYTVYLLGAITMFQVLGGAGEKSGNKLRRITDLPARLVAALALAALLGAAQLLPLLELAGTSSRALEAGQAAQYALTPLQLLLGLLLPAGQGGHETIIYLGLLPLLLLPLSFTRQNRWAWFYGGVLLFTLLFALGEATPLHALMYTLAPGFHWVRTPARMMFVGALAASVLAGLGLERLNTARWSPRANHLADHIGLAGGLLALLLGLGLAFGMGVQRAGLALALFVPPGLAVIVIRMYRRIAAQLATGLLVLLLLGDVLWFDHSLLRFSTLAEALSPGQPAAEYLAGQPGLFRVYSPSYSLPMQTAAAYNLRLVDGVEPARLARFDEFMARAGGYPNESYSVPIPNFGDQPLATALADAAPNPKLLGMLNVRYLAAAFPIDIPGLTPLAQPGGAYIYTNKAALPPAWVAYQSRPIATDWLAQLAALPNLADVVTIEQGPALPPTDRQAGAVTVTRYAPTRIALETDASAPGWLVLSEVWYPGWQATVNGIAQPVERVNGLLRGVYLPQAGHYAVTLIFASPTVIWGRWISGVTTGLVLLGLGWQRWAKRNPI